MGPTSGGKTTLARHFEAAWRERGVPVIVYDGDEVRDLFGEDHGFRPEDRMRVVSVLVHLANKAVAAGLNVIVSALTAHEDARRYIGESVCGLTVGYVECSIERCAERDPKGLYERARKGEITTLIGWNTPYEPPQAPDLVLNTETRSLDDLFVEADTLLRPENG
jgi:adenylylsulfate kinase